MPSFDSSLNYLNRVPPRAWFALLAVGSFGLVGVGLWMQSVLSLRPCPMCIFQRLLYLAIGAWALVGLLLPAARRLWAGLIVLVGLGGASVAGYQSWMQAFPDLANECSYTDPSLMERLVDWLGTLWPSLFMATGFCTSREWEFLGLSMANWSLVVFTGFAAFGLWLAAKK